MLPSLKLVRISIFLLLVNASYSRLQLIYFIFITILLTPCLTRSDVDEDVPIQLHLSYTGFLLINPHLQRCRTVATWRLVAHTAGVADSGTERERESVYRDRPNPNPGLG